MELVLVRHALPVREELAEGEVADPPLTPLGHEQAVALAEWLADERVDALYASPMLRARETADHVAARLGLEVRVDDELAEFDRQSHYYVPIEELRRLRDERWDALVAGRWGDDGEVAPEMFRAIVVEAVERIISAHPGETVVVVAHGGVMNAYLSHVLGMESVLFFEPAYTCISRVLASRNGERMLKSINEHGHVRALLAD